MYGKGQVMETKFRPVFGFKIKIILLNRLKSAILGNFCIKVVFVSKSERKNWILAGYGQGYEL